MKKLLLGSAVLTLFAISITLFQISCQKESNAQTSTYTPPPATTTSLGGVIIGNGLSVTSNGTLSVNSTGTSQQSKIVFTKLVDENLPTERNEIWIANYDGTNQTKVNYIVPSGLSSIVGDYDQRVRISPNGQKLFFDLQEIALPNKRHLYSCNIDGSGLVRIVDGGSVTGWVTMQAAY